MEQKQKRAKALRVSLWTAQIVLALLLLSGAVMKWLPIEKIAPMMPWTGELPEVAVRLLGVVDLLGAIGLVVPAALRWSYRWTVAAAVCVAVLMVCAVVFHVLRGEAEVIGVNVFGFAVAVFVAWGTVRKEG